MSTSLSSLFVAGAVTSKAIGERPDLAPGDIGPVRLRVTGTVGAEPVDFTVSATGVGVGAPSEATATCKVGVYDLAARLLRRMGCVGPAAEEILTEEITALLEGNEVDSRGIEAIAERLKKAFAANLPKVPRVGALSVKGAALVVADTAAEAAAAK